MVFDSRNIRFCYAYTHRRGGTGTIIGEFIFVGVLYCSGSENKLFTVIIFSRLAAGLSLSASWFINLLVDLDGFDNGLQFLDVCRTFGLNEVHDQDIPFYV